MHFSIFFLLQLNFLAMLGSAYHQFLIQNLTTCYGGLGNCTVADIGYTPCPTSFGGSAYCDYLSACGTWLGKDSCCRDIGTSSQGPSNISCNAFRGVLGAFRLPGSNTTNTDGFYPSGRYCGSLNEKANSYIVYGADGGHLTGNPNISTTDHGLTCCPQSYDSVSDLASNSAWCIPAVVRDGASSSSAVRPSLPVSLIAIGIMCALIF